MGAEKEDGGIAVERVLGAVPMVDIPINDQDAIDVVPALQVSGGDRDVIE
jgi:hypothetical protein